EILPPVRDSATATRMLCSVQNSERRSAIPVALLSCCSKLDTCVLYSESGGSDHGEDRAPCTRLSVQVCSGQKRAPANRGSDFDYPLLSVAAVCPIWRAQWEQQYMAPSASTPWPRMRHPQCAQLGAIFAIAHSKLSKVPDSSSRVSVNARSYSFPHVSQTAMLFLLRR